MFMSTVVCSGTPCFYPYELGGDSSDHGPLTGWTVESGVRLVVVSEVIINVGLGVSIVIRTNLGFFSMFLM